MTSRYRTTRLVTTVVMAAFAIQITACLDQRPELPTAPAQTVAGTDGEIPRLTPGGSVPVAVLGGDLLRTPETGPAPIELRRAVGSRLGGKLTSGPPPSSSSSATDVTAAAIAHSRHILLEHISTGVRAAWVVSNGVITSAFGLGTLDLNWSMTGAGDFNADLREDILWENLATGSRAVWLMNGTGGVNAAVNFGLVASEWRMAGAGDYNNDGKDDILWQNTNSGARALWLMSGGQVLGTVSLGVLEPQWRMIAAGDLDSDGKDDILLQHDDGRVVLYMMSNGAVINAASLGSMPSPWYLAGTGDIDGDAKEDVVWENRSTGVRAVWLMNGFGVVTSAPVLTIENTNWRIRGVLIPQKADPCDLGDAPVVTIGQTVNGTLAATDCRRTVESFHRYVDPYRLVLGVETTISIDLTAAYDAYLYLLNSTGAVIAAADDNVGLNPRLIITLPAGTYYLLASHYSDQMGIGPYQLKVGGLPCTNPRFLVSTVSGTLATTDCLIARPGGGTSYYADGFHFFVNAASSVTLNLTSTAFDTYLVVYNSQGVVVAFNDDDPAGPAGNRNSRIVTTLQTGTYFVRATSYLSFATGAYQLTGSGF